MANRGNKTNNNKALRDFLSKDPNSGGAADDFEKEALEGFTMLGDQKEILAAKEKLDQRMYTHVFSDKKSSSKRSYWLAAAALILIVGFAVFIVQQAEVSQPKDLAILEPKKIEKVPAPTEPSFRAPGETMPENKTTKTIPITPAADQALTRSAKPSEDLNEESEVKEMPAVKTLKQTEKAESKMNEAEGASGMDGEKVPENAEERKERASQAASPSLAGAGINANSPSVANGAGANQTTISEVEVVSVKKSQAKKMESTAQKDLISNCYYKGGEKILRKELKQKLFQKNLLKSFEAKLFINEERKVEKVEFINVFELSVAEQTQVITLLKSLANFEFHEMPKAQSLTEYRLIFKP
ncbi:MAG: hypothetical protein PSX36_13300 [bacterium]|nr:hypothetical protein [bacterium]